MRRVWAGVAGVAAAAGVGALAGSAPGRALDGAVFRAMNRNRGPRADAAFAGVTELGSLWASLGAAAVLMSTGRRRAATNALGAAVAMWGVGQALKRLTDRPRPYHAEESRQLIDEPRGTSWPSSHPAVLLAFVTVAARELNVRPSVRRALGRLADVVAASRVYVGVHYPSDVLAGLLLGRAVGNLWPGRTRARRLEPAAGPAREPAARAKVVA
jgi:membrane-associated phospholipid phosphatase